MTRVQLQARLSPFGEFEVVAITPGSGNGLLFPAEVLAASVPLWEGVSLFVDHDPSLPRHRLQDLGGVFHNPRWTGTALVGQVRTSGPKSHFVNDFARDWLEDVEAGRPTADLGLSADLLYRSQDGATFGEITKVLSLDLVFHPARGGAILRALNSHQGGNVMPPEVSPMAHAGPQAGQPEGASPAPAAAPPASTAPAAPTQATPRPAPPDEISGEELARAQCALLLDMALRASDLPDPSQAALRAQFGNRLFSPADLTAAIEQQRNLVTALRPSPVTGNSPRPSPACGRISIASSSPSSATSSAPACRAVARMCPVCAGSESRISSPPAMWR